MDTPQAVQPATDAPGGVATLREAFEARLCALVRVCEWDKCQVLRPRQKRFASDRCRAAWHDSLHPRINPPGLNLRAAGPIWKRYLGLMADGEWRTDRVAGDKLAEQESVVGRKRRWLTKRGHPFESRRLGGPQTPAQYKLLEPSAQAAA